MNGNPKAYNAELFFWLLWGLVLMIVRMMHALELLVKFLMILHGKKVGIATI
jgi:hypothetical protein